jgi:hypothetical protein
MKVRGRRRRRLAPWQRLRRSYTGVALSAAQAADAFAKLTAILGPATPRTPEVQARLRAYYDADRNRRATS